MCIFHKWTKWGEIKKELWERTYIYCTNSHTYTRRTQRRTCKKCGEIDIRYVEEY